MPKTRKLKEREIFSAILTAKSFDDFADIYVTMEQKGLLHCFNEAWDNFKIDTDIQTGLTEKIISLLAVIPGTFAGGSAASMAGATTFTFLGVGITTATAPLWMVGAGAVGGAALIYGAYKAVSSSASASGASRVRSKNIRDGKEDVPQPQRRANPFVFVIESRDHIMGLYDSLCLFADRRDLANEYLLPLFDVEEDINTWSEILEDYKKQCQISKDKHSKRTFLFFKKEDKNKSKAEMECLLEQLLHKSQGIVRNKIDEIATRIKQDIPIFQKKIDRAIALIKINMEFITPRVLHEEMDTLLKETRRGINLYSTFMREQLKAEFAICKMLASHSQNSPEQSKQQIALMEQIFAEKYGEYGARIADEMFKDTRPTKLNEGNFLEYLREILGIFEKENAQNFISTLYDDLHEYVKLDGKIEEYEANILKQISSLKD